MDGTLCGFKWFDSKKTTLQLAAVRFMTYVEDIPDLLTRLPHPNLQKEMPFRPFEIQ